MSARFNQLQCSECLNERSLTPCVGDAVDLEGPIWLAAYEVKAVITRGIVGRFDSRQVENDCETFS